jgi:hypothetical protein
MSPENLVRLDLYEKPHRFRTTLVDLGNRDEQLGGRGTDYF